MRYDFLLFDADGTLLDFLKSEREALWETLDNNGIQPTDEKIKLYSGINDSLWKLHERGEISKKELLVRRFELLLEALGEKAEVNKIAREYESRISEKGYLLDGAEEMCCALFGKARMFIVTNGLEVVQRGRYARCGIDKYFENVFISDKIGFQKPSVHFFEKVAECIDGFDKSRALIIGDSLTSDIKGGINFGIDTCWYNPDGKVCPADMNITHISNSFCDIVNFILGEEAL